MRNKLSLVLVSLLLAVGAQGQTRTARPIGKCELNGLIAHAPQLGYDVGCVAGYWVPISTRERVDTCIRVDSKGNLTSTRACSAPTAEVKGHGALHGAARLSTPVTATDTLTMPTVQPKWDCPNPPTGDILGRTFTCMGGEWVETGNSDVSGALPLASGGSIAAWEAVTPAPFPWFVVFFSGISLVTAWALVILGWDVLVDRRKELAPNPQPEVKQPKDYKPHGWKATK